MDTQRAFGLNGGLFNASALQIHGGNLSAANLGTLQTASGIEADRATRLWELWYQQKFFGDTFDVKVGQQSIDQEFMVSQNSGYFVNTMFGWPMLPSADMPGGGPAYPLSALGVRARAHLTDRVTVLAGVYNGSPAPNNNGDPQKLDPYGTSFPLNGGVLAIAELQYVYPGARRAGRARQARSARADLQDRRLVRQREFRGSALRQYRDCRSPVPLSTGIPRSHRGDYAIYAVADQMVWRSASEPDRTINVVSAPDVLATAGPQPHRLQPQRRLDDARAVPPPRRRHARHRHGLCAGQQPRGRARPGHRALQSRNVYTPVRHNETVFEATYQYQVMPWWQIQPDIQYVFNPGGGIVNPNDPTQKVKNELVFGVRTNITF